MASHAHQQTPTNELPARTKPPGLPPRWFMVSFWFVHRAVYRLTGGRVGLWRPKPGKWGAMRLNTIGRRSGKQRSVILGYYEDGPNLVTMALNGWADPEPAWWLNLQTQPNVTVDIKGGRREVRARSAVGAERDRLWAGWREMGDDPDSYAWRTSREAAIVVLEPRSALT